MTRQILMGVEAQPLRGCAEPAASEKTGAARRLSGCPVLARAKHAAGPRCLRATTTLRAARGALLALLLAGVVEQPSAHAASSARFRGEIPVDELLDKRAQVDLAGFEHDEPHYWKQIGTGKIKGGDAERDFRDLLEKAALDRSENPPSGTGAAPVGSPTSWIAFNFETGVEYLIELPSDYLQRIGEAALATGVTEPYKGHAPSSDQPEETSVGLDAKGWSDGVDTRSRRFDNTTYPYRAMGQINGGGTSGCSGTLIGPRHVLTAAHCVWDKSASNWYPFTFRPGREGTCAAPSCQPYGAHSAIWYFTPAAYRTSSVPDSWQHDYAIVTTANRPGDTTGWMGYVAVGDQALQNHCNDSPYSWWWADGENCKNRGYPACGLSGAPAGCVQGWAYQDRDHCQVANFRDRDADNWHSRFDVDCDLSGGHSGSALFSSDWPNPFFVVFGVASTHICTTCSPNQRWVNTFRSITPEAFNWISYFKRVRFP